jgi:hypothetical protein
VTTDGRWSNGVLSGAWLKNQAGYIGEGAREAARRARIEQLERELEEERAAIGELDEDLADVEARQGRLADEHRAMPPDGRVREAHTVGAEQRRQLAQARTDHAEAVTKRQAQEAATAAATTYAELLATVGTAVEELQRRLAEVTGALGRLKTAYGITVDREKHALEARGKADGKRGDCGRRSRRRHGSGTTRCASSRHSPPPGCWGSRCRRWRSPTWSSRGRRRRR